MISMKNMTNKLVEVVNSLNRRAYLCEFGGLTLEPFSLHVGADSTTIEFLDLVVWDSEEDIIKNMEKKDIEKTVCGNTLRIIGCINEIKKTCFKGKSF